jgi:hypothetical protein
MIRDFREQQRQDSLIQALKDISLTLKGIDVTLGGVRKDVAAIRTKMSPGEILVREYGDTYTAARHRAPSST